jgi:hypothetical protein
VHGAEHMTTDDGDDVSTDLFDLEARRALVAGAAVMRRALIAQGFALTRATVDGRGRVRLHAAFPCPQRLAEGASYERGCT